MSLALLAGKGQLPVLVHRACAAGGDAPLVIELEGVPSDLDREVVTERFRLETIGSLIARLEARGVRRLCLAGAVRRMPIDPALIDVATMPLVPRLTAALSQGDDGALRCVLALFEEAGIAIVGADELVPGLLPAAGWLGAVPPGGPGPELAADAARAARCVSALGALDIGQACVVSRGQVLAVETLPGTDWMLHSLAAGHDGAPGGVLYKAPKPGQDRRVDLPAIGPATVRLAAEAGLSGIVLAQGGVMVLGAQETGREAADLGLFIWVRDGKDGS
ncbi:LpxI family protein [Profundibacterium mesophilum]|uniref:Phosphatidate cytidylyltransferase n=1 Tax=Profundibacterium mesophilum KAUST100406-0324 TaxID=1037889 RepID=A0A921NX98_9RHOB|nr:UDP-2,3-diacylglucosamine diphosphatase LpxI [Profundibacterium mesophilum]KAF0675218.1 uncharacterized protein PMES_02481 [Profundibacterium mesophilum KAUST100406-0324]